MNTSSGTEVVVEYAEKDLASVLLDMGHWVWVCPNITRLGRVQAFFGRWDYSGGVQFQESKTSSVRVYTRIKYARIRLAKTTLEDPCFTRSKLVVSSLAISSPTSHHSTSETRNAQVQFLSHELAPEHTVACVICQIPRWA